MPVRTVPLRAVTALVLLCAAALAGCGGTGNDRTVTVLGSWTGAEGDAFREMLREFEGDTGIDVRYSGTRDARAVLASELHDGHPPDTAVLANPGDLRAYAADGHLRPVGSASRGIAAGPTTATGPDGGRRPYGIVLKASVKSLIWYNPDTLPEGLADRLNDPSVTWDDLASAVSETGDAPWCLGLEDTSQSGWPGTDWIEDLLLHLSGPEVYDAWVSGRLAWTAPEVRRAWEEFGTVLRGAHEGNGGVLLTGYGEAGQWMFADPPGCRFDHAGSFIPAFYAQAAQRPRPGRDFDFVPFPGRGTVEIGGDLLGMFRDTPAARALVEYLTSEEAQRTWIERAGSGAYSLNREIPPDDYPDDVSRRIAGLLAGAETVRFDASDSMPGVMAAAFNHAVLEYAADPAAERLDAILTALDKVRRTTEFDA
ncbi:ABC transporter substrate-binding protein [Actinomadura algeriensis]|uniref:Alpha-glucoside transport system substrate-binding protein n=1 Tax=Actinomadura algeriensis TaxID=1679523 RepID=A0ABR9K3B8_9ACTN|nr:ABC transporter substrate-binding protein [Actinomadura algeriensis]MBE1537193.1 alpha-glucoside transport system substrate-binding protein [Actinomadura algeriensis]